MFSRLGEMEYNGADTPLMVADTPDIASPRGTVFAWAGEGAKPEPATFNCIPGAKALRNDAAFVTEVIFVVGDAPTSNTTGTLMYAGVVLAEVTISVAWYTPLASPAAEAWILNCAGPVPESGETVSQLVVRLAGNTLRFHASVALPPKTSPTSAVAVCDASGTESV